jgi:putative oxidoreductase
MLMKDSTLVAGWKSFQPQFQSILRIVAAFMFMQAGTIKLFAWPMGMPPNGGTAEFMTQIWIGGVLEAAGGALMLIGLFTRQVAFILAGEMAVAYFQFHQPGGFWPVENGGVSAVIYCFVWLYFSAAGAGVWSVDATIKKGKRA